MTDSVSNVKRVGGFSLVELSIVLVILGLLTGGILAGQNLIRAAELRTTVMQYQQFFSATMAFKDRYFQLPGDFSAATQFWGRLNSNADCVTNSAAAVNASTGVCDGDGNGQVRAIATANQSSEELQAWRQLAAAGLVEGTYTGITNAGGGITGSAPTAKFGAQTRWRIRYIGDLTGAVTGSQVDTFAVVYGNVLELSEMTAGVGVFKPEEAWNIDKKIDDGKPAYGKMIGRGWDTCTTAISRTDLTGELN